MALSYKNDEQADERLNPAGLSSQENTAGENSGSHDAIQGYDRKGDGLDDHPITAGVANGEENPNGLWKGKAPEDNNEGLLDKNKFDKAWGIAKKRGGPLGLIALFGVTGGIMASFLGPATMIINLMENFAGTNDSSSTAMERRFIKVLENATKKEVCSSKKIKCKMGRVSNSALRKLERKGLTACYNNQRMPCSGTKKRIGYPRANPTHYQIDGKRVAATDLSGFLSQKENRKYARKVFGVGGAFNLQFRAWAGKHIYNKFYKKFGLKRNGGLADGQNNKKMTPAERAKAAIDKLRGRIPATSDGEDDFKNKIKSKLSSRLGTAKKGGPVYLTAAATCLGFKAPRLIIAGVAAIQLAQIMPVVMDTILSPGGKAKTSGATGEDLDTIGTMLTETTPRESDGKKTSALDSPYLLSAMGVNTNKQPVSKDYTPGYSLLRNKAIVNGLAAEKSTQRECDGILSPQAMYTAAAIDSAATVAASSTIIGGIIKLAVGYALTEIVTKIAEKAVTKLAGKAFKYFATNDKIPEARGQALGDVLGIGGAAFFASGGMSRHLPTLKKSQLAAYNQVKQENESFTREMDIAALSPFDTSSKYTFLGSMVHGMKTAVATNSVRNGGVTFGSMLLGASSLPSFAFSSPSASATDFTDVDYERYCDYAKDFGIDSDVAINMAGMPCTGITPQQATMATETATDLMLYEGWLDEGKNTDDGDTIEDLVTSGYIKDDTPLSDYIEQCSNPDEGDYMFNAPDCSIDCVGSCLQGSGNTNLCYTETGDDGETTRHCNNDSAEGVKDSRSLAAIPVFLLDYQIVQSMNGEDEEPEESGSSDDSSGTAVSGDLAWPMDKSFFDANRADWTGPHGSTGTSWGVSWGEVGVSSKGAGIASDIGDPPIGTPVYAMLGGEVVSTDLCGSNDGITIKSTVDGKNLFIAYMHGTDKEYNVGDSVESGKQVMKLGEIGCTVNGAHLHVGIAYDGKYVCPQDVFVAMDSGEAVDWEDLAGKAGDGC